MFCPKCGCNTGKAPTCQRCVAKLAQPYKPPYLSVDRFLQMDLRGEFWERTRKDTLKLLEACRESKR